MNWPQIKFIFIFFDILSSPLSYLFLSYSPPSPHLFLDTIIYLIYLFIVFINLMLYG